MSLRIAFRTDASLHIGTGHVMRCLTLADALLARGAECHFLCRAHEGSLIEFIRAKGHRVHSLPVVSSVDALDPHRGFGAKQVQNFDASVPILAALRPDWLIVDHYAVDARWERALAMHCGRLMVIDDLANRPHACDVLLDQTVGRVTDDYRAWVSSQCQLLCGSRYALLRPEFPALRPYSLQRRAQPQVRQLLVSMGGVDKDNATGQVLAALCDSSLPDELEITVVLGASAPWQDEVECQAQTMPWPTRVRVDVGDMAQLMADSDLAIGAAGTTSWERCCLGLPTIMRVLVENQSAVAQGLDQVGAARVIEQGQSIRERLPVLLAPFLDGPLALARMSKAASAVVDGNGVNAVIPLLES